MFSVHISSQCKLLRMYWAKSFEQCLNKNSSSVFVCDELCCLDFVFRNIYMTKFEVEANTNIAIKMFQLPIDISDMSKGRGTQSFSPQ